MKNTFIVLIGLLASSVLGNVWSFWRVLRPVQNLAARATNLAQGDMLALEQPCAGIREIGQLQNTMASMAAHVQRAQVEGLTYRHALTDGQEAERARIAHELHDDTVQSLVGIAQSLDLAANWISTDPQRAKTLLQMTRTQAVDSVNSLRRLIADLRPPALEELGIATTLHLLARDINGVQVDVHVSGSERRIGEAHELALFRVAQEALRNAEKHAQPNHILLNLTFEPNAIRLLVQDNGIGFNPPASLDCLAQVQHFGLLGMQERVQQLHGTLHIISQPGGGTIIEVLLPLVSVEQPVEQVRDPVCGAIIEPQRAFSNTVYQGERHYFCCPVCQGAFHHEPQSYLLLKA